MNGDLMYFWVPVRWNTCRMWQSPRICSIVTTSNILCLAFWFRSIASHTKLTFSYIETVSITAVCVAYCGILLAWYSQLAFVLQVVGDRCIFNFYNQFLYEFISLLYFCFNIQKNAAARRERKFLHVFWWN